MDIEGAEARIIKDGIELVPKYHLPFIVTECQPVDLNKHGICPMVFIEMFLDNGYKMLKRGFFP